AYEVRLEIEFPDEFTCQQVYGKKPIPGTVNPLKFQLPNLYNGANQVALAILELKNAIPEIAQKPVKVRIRYKEKIDGPDVFVEQIIYPEWEEGDGHLRIAIEKEQKKLYAIAEMNRAIKVMSDEYSAGNHANAQKILEETIQRIRELYPDAKDKDVKALFDSMEGYLEAFKNLSRKRELGIKKGLK
ncbi:MAG: hypothetical protein LPK45_02870, partial [Bacteroidota bacterium]|nr:hypothetical protein [Bacteroidota bacterium]MDX5429982.1 hypothetical protein [Bacteroidota bacterium]MDX5468755.1 hypothetical protein [Bacteroidota bacterium]